ncbi:MAG: ankyrin repeat domain-containing protein [Candidatus Paceibacterota bacterium]
MKLFNFDKVVTKNLEKIVDDLSQDSEISERLTNYMDNLANHKNKDSTEYFHIKIQIISEYVNLGYSLSKILNFLDKHKLSIDFYDNIILRTACDKGNLKFIKLLIQEYGDLIKLDAWYQSPIRYAVQHGNLELVNFLLGFPQVDPSNPLVLTLAVTANHHEIAIRLLQDDRVDPKAWDNHALNYAKEYHKVNPDYHRMIQLLSHPKK